MFNLIFILCSISIFLSITFLFIHKTIIGFLPNLFWTIFISIPLLLSWNYFENNVILAQSIGVGLTHSIILLADLFSVLALSARSTSNHNRYISIRNFPLTLIFLIVLIIPIWHYVLVGSVPIIRIVDREYFNKFGIPYYFALISTIVFSVFMPFLIVYATFMKKYKLSLFILSWGLLYSFSTSSKGAVIYLLGAIIFASFFCAKENNKLSFIFSTLSLVLLFVTLSAGIFSLNVAKANSNGCSLPAGVKFTPANFYHNGCSNYSLPIGTEFILSKAITLSTRMILTPMEVSNYWYDLTLSNPNESRSIADLFDRTNANKFSNKIGIKYFVTPFPNSYKTSINANASIDADAFSFYKFYSLIFVALIYSFIRVFIGIMSIHLTPSIRILSGIGLSKLILLPFSAGLQAILVPHGLALIVILILILKSKYAKSIIFK